MDYKSIAKLLSEDTLLSTEVIRQLDKFLSDLLSIPEFIHEIVIDFLEIPNPYKEVFLDNAKHVAASSQNKHSKDPNRSLLSVDLKILLMDHEALNILDLLKLQTVNLEICKMKYYLSEVENEILYMFRVRKLEENGPEIEWNISKSYSGVQS